MTMYQVEVAVYILIGVLFLIFFNITG